MTKLTNSFQFIVFLILSIACMTKTQAVEIRSIDGNPIIVCPVQSNSAQPPDFSDSSCQTKPLYQIDPQQQQIWLKTTVQLTTTQTQPLALYVFAKTSSEAYLNGHYLGKNGTPNADARKEFAGNMDSHFYLPPQWIKSGDNELIIRLSAHHGFLKLSYPINFIGIGEYTDLRTVMFADLIISLSLFGALLLGGLYFTVLAVRADDTSEHRLFVLMAAFATSQLFAEMTRGLFNYSYPWHDIRLLSIVTLALGFGLTLHQYTIKRFAQQHNKLWWSSCALFTLIMVILLPGFDGKTAIAILIPALTSTLLIAVRYYQQREQKLLGYLATYAIFCLTIIFTFSAFHSLMFYYIITAMVACLFVKQANELIEQQNQRKTEQEQRLKLQLKLDQNQQRQAPSKLKLTGAGKTQLIATDTISYCKAAGDYVEIHLNDQQQQLYSGSMKSLETLLPNTFLKVHRSYLVNLEQVSSISSNAGNGFLALQNQQQVPVSRRVLPKVRGVINNVATD